MTEQEEDFAHFVSCISSLNNAWQLLTMIHTQQGNPLVLPAFRFALIEYSKPYKVSYRGKRKLKQLDASRVPPRFLALHERIIRCRDQIHAHLDLTPLDAKLHLHEFMGHRYAQISQNYIHGGEELPNIQEIISLIEETLEKMYVEENDLEKAIA